MGKSASDVRAGGAFWEMYAKDGVSGVLDGIQKRILKLTSFMQRAGTRATILGGALTAPLTAFFKGGIDRAADLARLEKQLGVPIPILNKLQYAADAAGVSLDEVMQDRQGRYSDLIARAPDIDPEDARAAANAQLELADATRAMQLALLPLVKTLGIYVKLFANFVKDNAGAAQTVLAVGVGLIALGVCVKLLAVAFAILIPVANLAWLAIGGPFGLAIAAGIAGGTALALTLAYLTDGFALVGSTARAVGATVSQMWEGIGAALAKGDLALAGQIAIKGLQVLWLEFVESTTAVWNMFKGAFVDGWHFMGLQAALAMNDLAAGIATVFEKAAAAVINALHWVGRTAIDVGLKALKALDSVDPTDSLKGKIAALEAMRGGLGGVAADTGAIERDRAGRERILRDDEAHDALERKKARDKDLLEAAADLKKAKGELADLKDKAKAPGEPDRGPFTGGDPLKLELLGATQAKGSFSGAALSAQLGYADQTQKQTELLKLLKDGNGLLPVKIGFEVGKQIFGAFKIN